MPQTWKSWTPSAIASSRLRAICPPTTFAEEDERDDLDEDERHDPEEVEEEIADIYEEFNERKALRPEAFEAFLKIEPKQLISDEALYREMRANYRDYFTGGMGAEAVRDLLGTSTLRRRLKSCVKSSPRARARSAPRP